MSPPTASKVSEAVFVCSVALCEDTLVKPHRFRSKVRPLVRLKGMFLSGVRGSREAEEVM